MSNHSQPQNLEAKSLSPTTPLHPAPMSK